MNIVRIRNNVTLLTRLTGLLLLAGIISSCELREQKKEYLARVGDSYLTQEQVAAAGDSTIVASNARLHDYANRWVNNEILFQEAQHRGIENSEMFQSQLTEARKRLAIELLLQKEVYNDTMEIPEDSIRTYFETHPNDFRLRDKAIKLNLIGFAARERVNTFRAKIMGGIPWELAVQFAVDDSAMRGAVVRTVSGMFFTQHTLYPPELWRVASYLLPREVSFPIKTQVGYFVIQPLMTFQQGSRASFDMVRDEIRQRLLIEQRKTQYASLISNLRSRYEVEVFVP